MAETSPHALDHFAGDLVARIGAPDVKPDVYESMVEGSSSVCATAAEAAAELEGLREAMRDASATLAGAGVHPTAAFGEVRGFPRAVIPRGAHPAARHGRGTRDGRAVAARVCRPGALVRETAEPLYGYTRTTVPMRTQL